MKGAAVRRLFAIRAVDTLLGAAEPAASPPSAPICHAEAKPSDAQPAKALLTGYGTGGFKIATQSPEAQAYFDNGMQLAHAFAHGAATSAFKRAEQLDPTCAMCVWGEAWSRGPTINYPIDKAEQADLAGLVRKAAVLAAGGPSRERAMIAALAARYRDGGGKGPGDDAFARAMDALARAWPGDNEIAVIAADAWMIPASHRTNRDHLDRAIDMLEAVLRRAPDDTGAIHFSSHATEMDGVGAKALPYAQKLQALAPAASHLVHMPSHTYFLAGWYRAAEQSNLDAVAIDAANAERLGLKDGAFGLTYHGHNVQYGEGAALMDGDARGALALAEAEAGQLASVQPDHPFGQFGLGTAYFVYGRYGSPAEVASLADPGARLPYVQAMWRYAKGEAAARRGDTAAVEAQAAAISIAPADIKPFGDMAPQAKAMVEIARLVLIGRSAMLEGRFADAETAYRSAAEIQEAKLGGLTDPPEWWYPVRRSQAAALEAEGKPQVAATEARKAMVGWPSDPVGLKILADSETAQGQAADAGRELARAREGWAGDLADVPAALE